MPASDSFLPTYIHTSPTSSQIDILSSSSRGTWRSDRTRGLLWCPKMSQLMMDAPNLVKDAGQEQGGEVEASALAATGGLTDYGKYVLASSAHACKAVKRRFRGSAKDATDTTSYTADAASGSASTASQRR
ncbi:hypothetical protein BGX30_000953 [Mortierella sp. GBA39]|nr:hypothetical protein BGX30_000953 [Mortierella sp. GBA39]